jgi:hypothetical protein
MVSSNQDLSCHSGIPNPVVRAARQAATLPQDHSRIVGYFPSGVDDAYYSKGDLAMGDWLEPTTAPGTRCVRRGRRSGRERPERAAMPWTGFGRPMGPQRRCCICRNQSAVSIFDEIMTGNGRARPRPAAGLRQGRRYAKLKEHGCAHLRRPEHVPLGLGWTSGAQSFCSRRYPAVNSKPRLSRSSILELRLATRGRAIHFGALGVRNRRREWSRIWLVLVWRCRVECRFRVGRPTGRVIRFQP